MTTGEDSDEETGGSAGFFWAVFVTLVVAVLGPPYIHALIEIGKWSWNLIG